MLGSRSRGNSRLRGGEQGGLQEHRLLALRRQLHAVPRPQHLPPRLWRPVLRQQRRRHRLSYAALQLCNCTDALWPFMPLTLSQYWNGRRAKGQMSLSR